MEEQALIKRFRKTFGSFRNGILLDSKPHNTPEEKKARIVKLSDLLCVSLISIYVFAFTYLPMQDYPNWLYQGYLFKEFLLHGNMLNGFFHFYPYIPPNAISTIVVGCLSVIVTPYFAGKCFLFLTALLLYLGMKSYLSLFVANANILITCLAFYLVFNLHFLMGVINFSFGLGLALLVLSYLVRNHLSVNRITLSLLLLLVYLSHFYSFITIPMFLVVYAYHTKEYKAVIRLAPAFIPVVILFIEYYLAKSINDLPLSTDTDSIFGQIHLILHSIFSVMIPFHNYKWLSEPGLISKSGNYLFSFLAGIFILRVFYISYIQKRWTLSLRLSLGLIILIIFIPRYFGGVMLPATRFVIFFTLNIVAVYLSRESIGHHCRMKNIISILLVTISFSYNVVNAYYFNKQIYSGIIPLDAIYEPRYAIEGTDGFMHLIFYHGIEHKEALRPFKSGLFTYPDEEKGASFGNE